MKFEPPPGSMFGGYGFWTYSDTPHTRRAGGSGNSRPHGQGELGWCNLRALAHAASRLLGHTRS